MNEPRAFLGRPSHSLIVPRVRTVLQRLGAQSKTKTGGVDKQNRAHQLEPRDG